MTDAEQHWPEIVEIGDDELIATIRAAVAKLLGRERNVRVQLQDGHHMVRVFTEDPGEKIEGRLLARLQRAIALILDDPGTTVVDLNIPEMDAMACSFCGKVRADVDVLVAGPGVNICGACIEVSAKVVERHAAMKTAGGSGDATT